MAQTVQDATQPEVTNEVDVLVVGGGTAGHVAAIQAGRAGAKTLIVERNSQLAVTLTNYHILWEIWTTFWGLEPRGKGKKRRRKPKKTQGKPFFFLTKLGTNNTPFLFKSFPFFYLCF